VQSESERKKETGFERLGERKSQGERETGGERQGERRGTESGCDIERQGEREKVGV